MSCSVLHVTLNMKIRANNYKNQLDLTKDSETEKRVRLEADKCGQKFAFRGCVKKLFCRFVNFFQIEFHAKLSFLLSYHSLAISRETFVVAFFGFAIKSDSKLHLNTYQTPRHKY
jgi:hypothetical protein